MTPGDGAVRLRSMTAPIEGRPSESPESRVLALEGVAADLTVSTRRRVDFLRELQHDVEALTTELVDSGLPHEEAHRRACELLLPDGEVLDRWSTVHESMYSRGARALDERRLRRVEQGLFTALVAAVAALGVRLVIGTEVLHEPSAFLWPVLAVGILLFAACLFHAAQIWGRGRRSAARSTLWWVLFGCAGSVVLGCTGVVTDLILLFGRLEADPSSAGLALVVSMRKDATLLAIAIVQAMGGAVFWLVATQWIAISEDALTRAVLDTRQSLQKEAAQ